MPDPSHPPPKGCGSSHQDPWEKGPLIGQTNPYGEGQVMGLPDRSGQTWPRHLL